jgi:hypothetical protein
MFINKYKHFFLGLAALSFLGGSKLCPAMHTGMSKTLEEMFGSSEKSYYKDSTFVGSKAFFEDEELIKRLKKSGKVSIRIIHNKSLIDKLEIFADELVSLSIDSWLREGEVRSEIDEEFDFSSLDFRKFKNLKHLEITMCSRVVEGTVPVEHLLDKMPDSVESLSFQSTYDSEFDFGDVDFSRFKNLKTLGICEGFVNFSSDSLKTVNGSLEWCILPWTDLSGVNFSKFKNLKVLVCILSSSDEVLNSISDTLVCLSLTEKSEVRDLSRFNNLKLLGINGQDFTVALRDSLSDELVGLEIIDNFDSKAGDFSRFKKLIFLEASGCEFSLKILDTISRKVKCIDISNLLLDSSHSNLSLNFCEFKNLEFLSLYIVAPSGWTGRVPEIYANPSVVADVSFERKAQED